MKGIAFILIVWRKLFWLKRGDLTVDNVEKSLLYDYDPEIYNKFMIRINEIVESYLQKHSGMEYHGIPSDKVIHDPVWGSVKFRGAEIAIIDTPLFQRLRDIYQVGLGVFTYPSARHSRFEHSLGTVAIATRMISSLKEHKSSIVTISDDMVTDVRLAALLHDVGHCFYSHLSESFYGALPEFTKLLRYFKKEHGVIPKAHEVFSFMIINSDAFKGYINSNRIFDSSYIRRSVSLDSLMLRIGNMIIGAINEGRSEGENPHKTYSFLTRIINGDIDADKLDYIKRDSYTSGLPLAFDIERLLYKIAIREPKDNPDDYQLVVDIAGITAVEEITFSKLMLVNYIYHHQKVLATEVMAKDIAEALMQLGDIKHPCDFLRYTDKKIEALIDDDRIPFNKYGCTKELFFFIRRIKDRYLPKRCFEINSRVLEPVLLEERGFDRKYREEYVVQIEQAKDLESKIAILEEYAANTFELGEQQHNPHTSSLATFISKFQKSTYEDYIKSIRQEICDKIIYLYEKLKREIPVGGISVFDIHMVLPKTRGEEKFSTPIVYGNTQGETPTDMLSYTKNWAQAFNTNKWSGYIFTSPHIDVTIAFKASLLVLKKHMGNITFTEPEFYVKYIDRVWLNRIDSILNSDL